jgi:hypothetical protein
VSTPARAVLAVVVAAVAGAGGARPASASEPITTPAGVTWTPRLLLQSDGVVARHGADAPDIEDGTTHPGLYLRRARLGADATSGVWRARLEIEAAGGPEVVAPAVTPSAPPLTTVALDPIAGVLGGGAPRATEAFLSLAPHKAFVLSAGSLRVPLGLSRQVGEADLRLPERARIAARATPDFRAGVAAAGDLGLLQYNLGAYSAAPALGADFGGGGSLYVLRLGGEPVGPMGVAAQLRRSDDPWYGWWRFAVGLSAFYAALPGANEFGIGGDGQFQWRRLLITGEALWTRRDTDDRAGFTIEPGVFVWADRLEVVARGEWFNDRTGPRTAADAWGAALGATFYSFTRTVRLQAAYTLRHTPSDNRTPGWAVLRATFVVE